jgi:nucleoside-diphosphate-sugar epimerase
MPVATPEMLGFAPASIYAATKAAQELLLLAGCESLGAPATILRLQDVYGAGHSLRNPYTGIVSIFFNQARQGLPINLYEDGLATRDFVHVDDVVSAFPAAIDADLPHGVVMNVGSGLPTSIIDLARTQVKVAGFDVPQIVSGKFRLGTSGTTGRILTVTTAPVLAGAICRYSRAQHLPICKAVQRRRRCGTGALLDRCTATGTGCCGPWWRKILGSGISCIAMCRKHR